MISRQSFEKYASTLRQKAYHTGLFILKDKEMAEDIAQETLLKLWMAREKIDADRPLEALTITIARNEAISRLRSTSPERWFGEDQQSVASSSNPQAELEEKENDRWLQQKIAAIPPACRAILHMSQNEGLENSEIARITGCTEASVRAMLSKARKQLFQQLQKRNQYEK